MIYPAEVKISAVQSYQEGDSFRVIGARCGADHKTVRRWIRNAGGNGRDRLCALRSAMKKRRGVSVSPATEFKKGQQPWNAGTGGTPILNKYRGRYVVYIKERDRHICLPYARYLMEQKLGRELSSNEGVHHINFNCLDDRLENLQLVTKSEHSLIHWEKRKSRGDKLCSTKK